MIDVKGKNGISAKIVADSICKVTKKRLTTIETIGHRWILAEQNTHRSTSKNSASCLHGDTKIYFDLPKKAKDGKYSCFKKTIADLYQSYEHGITFSSKSKLKPIDVSMVAPDTEYFESDLSNLVFSCRSTIGSLRRKTNDIPHKIVGGRAIILGSDFITWANNRSDTVEITHSQKNLIRSLKIRTLNEDTGNFETSNIAAVTYSGKKSIFQLTIDGGYKIKCTDNHRIFTNDGWKTLNDMGLYKMSNGKYAFNDSSLIACNGELVEEPMYKNIDWLISQRDSGKTLREITKEFGWNYKTVGNFVYINKIPFQKKIITENETFEYKDKDWLLEQRNMGLTCGRIAELCNTTEDRVKKQCKKHKITGMIGVVLVGNKKRVPWNTGLKYKNGPMDEKYIKRGKDNPCWAGGYEMYKSHNQKVTGFLTAIRISKMEEYNWKCAITGSNHKLEMHHIDPTWNNRDRSLDPTNIIVLCKKIHRKIHAMHLELEFRDWLDSGKSPSDFNIDGYERQTCAAIKKPVGSRKLKRKFNKLLAVEYIGEDDTYDIEVVGPFHNFVADGVVVHNSRAVPLKRAASLLETDAAYPVHWGKNQPGMTSKEELTGGELSAAKSLWEECINLSINFANEFDSIRAHKQWAARILEPFTMTKVLTTATDWDNFFWLRNDEEAQPEFQELASCMQQAMNQSIPVELNSGEWHLPYVNNTIVNGSQIFLDADGNTIDLELAKKISASCCAQISYRRLDDSVQKAIDIYDKLFSGRKPHLSPTEHQGTPIAQNGQWIPKYWPDGVTHIRRDGTMCSGNFSGWVQYRQTLPNNVYVKD